MNSNSTPTKEELAESLHALLDQYDFSTCLHENTHRGGCIWTICSDCGKQWADDEGGFLHHKEPAHVTRARDLLSRMGEKEKTQTVPTTKHIWAAIEDLKVQVADLQKISHEHLFPKAVGSTRGSK